MSIFQDTINIAHMVSHTRIMSIKPSKGFLKPKKKRLHKMLKTKFNPKAKATMAFWFFLAFVHVKYSDKAIRKNKIVHAIGKTKLGGVILGFIC